MNPSSLTRTPLSFIDAANGVTYAYRRFGQDTGTPLLFLQHFRGNIDNWDPRLIDQIAQHRDVIAFDNTGVGGSNGDTPSTVEEMADDAIAFLLALDLEQVDLFGFSLGGFIAQDIALSQPHLVRRLILAGTGPKSAPGMARWSPTVEKIAVADDFGPASLLPVFYTATDNSQVAGIASLARIYGWQEGRDKLPSVASKDAQYRAVLDWGARSCSYVARLVHIHQPTLILQGDNDAMIPTKASYILAGLIPESTIKIYADSSHGSIFQHADQAAADTIAFLSA